ncbi:hypothetical protein QJS10_CPA05g01235 [Acorus calamus]|uniref:Uncharacterized protein n=1 Tax=Acorus calamus TaxID=4465 RepID=A0AAV9ETF1_ACOCL|nr:hypothetical protein QJS10_CPA05g01235 [Acorus calamus]
MPPRPPKVSPPSLSSHSPLLLKKTTTERAKKKIKTLSFSFSSPSPPPPHNSSLRHLFSSTRPPPAPLLRHLVTVSAPRCRHQSRTVIIPANQSRTSLVRSDQIGDCDPIDDRMDPGECNPVDAPWQTPPRPLLRPHRRPPRRPSLATPSTSPAATPLATPSANPSTTILRLPLMSALFE